jgi:hypothetical protein
MMFAFAIFVLSSEMIGQGDCHCWRLGIWLVGFCPAKSVCISGTQRALSIFLFTFFLWSRTKSQVGVSTVKTSVADIITQCGIEGKKPSEVMLNEDWFGGCLIEIMLLRQS